MKCISLNLVQKEERQIMITKYVNDKGKVLELLKWKFLVSTALVCWACFVAVGNFFVLKYK